jgi:hypothetical protein
LFQFSIPALAIALEQEIPSADGSAADLAPLQIAGALSIMRFCRGLACGVFPV